MMMNTPRYRKKKRRKRVHGSYTLQANLRKTPRGGMRMAMRISTHVAVLSSAIFSYPFAFSFKTMVMRNLMVGGDCYLYATPFKMSITTSLSSPPSITCNSLLRVL